MNKPFSTIKANIGTMIQDTSSAMDTRIGVWVNNRYREIIRAFDWQELYKIQAITATAGASAYPMEENSDEFLSVLDTTQRAYLEETNQQEFLMQHYDDFDSSGTPTIYFPTYEVVRKQPSSTTKPIAVSSAGGDTQSVFIRGISASMELYESLTLNGTTSVTASNSYTRIFEITKSGATTGKVTVYENDASTVLSVLSPERLESRYLQLNLHRIPTGATVYHVRSRREILPFSQASDYPVIRGISDVLEWAATADAWRYKRQFQKAKDFDIQYQLALSERIQQEMDRPNLMHQMVPTPLSRDDGIL